MSVATFTAGRFEGWTAIVTGAGSGIGRATAIWLAWLVGDLTQPSDRGRLDSGFLPATQVHLRYAGQRRGQRAGRFSLPATGRTLPSRPARPRRSTCCQPWYQPVMKSR